MPPAFLNEIKKFLTLLSWFIPSALGLFSFWGGGGVWPRYFGNAGLPFPFCLILDEPDDVST
jgi:hypothetical protein